MGAIKKKDIKVIWIMCDIANTISGAVNLLASYAKQIVTPPKLVEQEPSTGETTPNRVTSQYSEDGSYVRPQFYRSEGEGPTIVTKDKAEYYIEGVKYATFDEYFAALSLEQQVNLVGKLEKISD